MNYKKYILAGIILLMVGYLLWYFNNIIAYVLISIVLSLLGAPIVTFMSKFKIGKFKIPRAISAMLALFLIWFSIILFIIIFLPLIANEAKSLSEINPTEIIKNIDEPLNNLDAFISKYHLMGNQEILLKDYAAEKIISFASVAKLSNILKVLIGILGNIFVAIFAISFITFFFLKDDKLVTNVVFTIVPDKYDRAIKHILLSIKKLLTRYFVGIVIDVILMIVMITIGLTIIGLDFNHAIVIGLFAGIFNVVPYVGPIIAILFGITMGIVTHLNVDFYLVLVPLISYMLIVFVIAQIIDAVFIQPYIFSNSVKAHPLEIFLVIMIAGSFAGIIGMVLAIPSYTVLRVVAKEFFTSSEVVRKLTEKI
ncbi:MAG TPA: AI-2E family transporter [Bacteroidales bacterium]|nr:MAG: hypothetical protein A2W98_07335 [Bacteroidetes bacterium GWF2_33_38]OFY74175.1 MAG: hypothetical protein A2265_04840 [Bacteroidetes bacterium RIFOXYA12_FULL_33_9]OFY87811.1 MAG: hypothetical protein A2236_01360 [Bacteroidetes bacterium RIFOXYA2_FULL_33_7]HBF88192.1 AI-2E family transporter [Bacteroidales bacterium]